MFKKRPVRDVGLDRLSILMSSVEPELVGPSSPSQDYGSVQYVVVRAEDSTRVGLPETPAESTIMIDYGFHQRLAKWVGPLENPRLVLAEAELNMADPDFPEDLKPRLAEALAGWYRLEVEHAEIFATFRVLAPGDRAFQYY